MSYNPSENWITPSQGLLWKSHSHVTGLQSQSKTCTTTSPVLQPKWKLMGTAFLQARSRTVTDGRRQGLPGHAVSSETRSHLHPSQGCRHGTYSTGDFFPDRAATASSHKKGGRSCWLEINSCHSTLGFQPGTTGKLLPCFSNSLFTHLTWQKQHKRGQQQNRFPGHLMGVWTSYRHLYSPSSPPAFPLSPPGLPPVQVTHLWSRALWGSSGLPHCVCTVTISSPSPPPTCFHNDTDRGDHLAPIFLTSWFYTSFCQWYRQMTRKVPRQKPQAVLHQASRSSEERLVFPFLEQSYGRGPN